MTPKQIDELLNQFADKNQFALELASRDAAVYGFGFCSLDKDGNVTYIDPGEAYELAKKILDET